MLIPFALSDFRAFASKTSPAIKTTHKTKPRRPKSERGLSVSQAAFRSPKTREFPRQPAGTSSGSAARESSAASLTEMILEMPGSCMVTP